MQNLLFTLNTVAPVFLIVFLGFYLKQHRLMNQNFVSVSSKVVFSVTLPALIFIKMSTANFKQAFNFKQIIFVYIGILFFYLLSWVISTLLTTSGKDQAGFIQGCFRSNFAIVGFAIITNMFENQMLEKAVILLAIVLPLYNILAVIALTVPLNAKKRISYKQTTLEILSNPLLLAVFIALPFSFLKIVIPQFLIRTIEHLAALTLPLALLGIGASLNFESIRKDSKLALMATMIKIIAMPATLTSFSYLFGFHGEDLIVMFILFASPTAIASFIMTDAMGGNSKLVGNIIVMTTLGSVFTISLGIFIMKSIGLL